MKADQNSGKALEKTVRLIQEALLESQPGLEGEQFTIEQNKRITIGGTRHEVDVYVVTQPGTPYESVVLFECKDWKKPVSKNEFMILKEKVEQVGATRGVLVAPRISKDARALLEDYKRIQYHRCTSNELESLCGIQIMHLIHDPLRIRGNATFWGSGHVLPENPRNAVFRWGSKVMIFEEFVRERLEGIWNRDRGSQPRKYEGEGTHWHNSGERLEFLPGESTLCGFDVAILEIQVTSFVTVTAKAPCYRCSIIGQGHVASFEVVSKGAANEKYELDVVITERRTSAKSA